MSTNKQIEVGLSFHTAIHYSLSFLGMDPAHRRNTQPFSYWLLSVYFLFLGLSVKSWLISPTSRSRESSWAEIQADSSTFMLGTQLAKIHYLPAFPAQTLTPLLVIMASLLEQSVSCMPIQAMCYTVSLCALCLDLFSQCEGWRPC